MRSPSIIVLVVVLLVLLSGCSGIFEPASRGATDVAPGVSTKRVTDASTLATAHRAILENTSYTYTSNYSQRVSADEYHYGVDHGTLVWVAADGSYLYYHHAVVNGTEHSSEYVDGVWANESVAVTRTVNLGNNSVTYARYRPPEPYPAANVTRSGVPGTLDNATVTERWNESGSVYVRVRVNESETRRWQTGNRTTVNLTTRRTATATIREDGYVTSFDSSLTGERPLPVAADDSTASTNRPIAQIDDQNQIRYSSVGTTDVPKPAWVDTALAATEGRSYGNETRPQAPKNPV